MKNKFLYAGFILFALISGAFIFALLDGLYIKKDKYGGFQIKTSFFQRISNKENSKSKEALDYKWAKEIAKGGYILHLRHGMREKFSTSVFTFDAIELLNKDDARKEDYARAVCLTERGILDSKVVGKTFDLAG